MRLVNCVVGFDLTLAALGALSAWYLGQPAMYVLCAQIAVGGMLLKVVARAYDNVKADWLKKGK